jgi:hypothetical protein
MLSRKCRAAVYTKAALKGAVLETFGMQQKMGTNGLCVMALAAGSRAHELTLLLDFQPVADGSSFGAAVLAAAAASS